MDRRGLWICAAMRPAQAAPQSCAGAPRAVLRTQTLRRGMFESAAQGIVLRPSERYGTRGHQATVLVRLRRADQNDSMLWLRGPLGFLVQLAAAEMLLGHPLNRGHHAEAASEQEYVARLIGKGGQASAAASGIAGGALADGEAFAFQALSSKDISGVNNAADQSAGSN
eukprot:s2334_g11.t1